MIRLEEKNGFREICGQLGAVSRYFAGAPLSVERNAQELRLRAGKPPVAELGTGRYAFHGHILTREDIESVINALCNYSVYNYEREFREGFITLRGGHRAGFCGTASVRNGRVENVKSISSVNIRIAREHKGCGEGLAKAALAEDFRGMLIFGRPLSGKTTVLRDLARILGQSEKVALIDARSEIAAVYNGIPQNDVGVNTDVLDGYPKGEALETAVRVLSPSYIICDEITGEQDELVNCVNCGVKLIATAHCSSFDEAEKINFACAGAFGCAAMMGCGSRIGQVLELRKADENGRFSRREELI